MERYNLAIIIPAFNEENSIKKMVESVLRYGEVIVINDGSKDQTSLLAKRSGALVIDHQNNLGYDKALNSGFKKASDLGFEFAITLDADGQHDPSFIKNFLDELLLGFDIVIGIRDFKQRFSEILFSFFTFYKWGIKDPLCGFKAYRLSLFRSCGCFDRNNLIGTELMLYGVSKKYKFSQININCKKRIGHPKFGNRIKANLKILKAFFFALFNY